MTEQKKDTTIIGRLRNGEYKFPFNFVCCNDQRDCKLVGTQVTLPEDFEYLDKETVKADKGWKEVKDGKIKIVYSEESYDKLWKTSEKLLEISNQECSIKHSLSYRKVGDWFVDERNENIGKIEFYFDDPGDPSVGIWGFESELNVKFSKDHELSEREMEKIKPLSKKLAEIPKEEMYTSVEFMEVINEQNRQMKKIEKEMEKDWRQRKEAEKRRKEREEEITKEELEEFLEGADEAYEYWRDREMEKSRGKSRF